MKNLQTTPELYSVEFTEQSLQLSVSGGILSVHTRYTYSETQGTKNDHPVKSVLLPKRKKPSNQPTIAYIEIHFGLTLVITLDYNPKLTSVKIKTIENGEAIPYSEQNITSLKSLDGFVLTV